jgi:hypothetical protein
MRLTTITINLPFVTPRIIRTAIILPERETNETRRQKLPLELSSSLVSSSAYAWQDRVGIKDANQIR